MSESEGRKLNRVIAAVQAHIHEPDTVEEAIKAAWPDPGPTYFDRWFWPFKPENHRLREPGAYVSAAIAYCFDKDEGKTEDDDGPGGRLFLDVTVGLKVWDPSMDWYPEDSISHKVHGVPQAHAVAHGLLEVIVQHHQLQGLPARGYDPRADVRAAPDRWLEYVADNQATEEP